MRLRMVRELPVTSVALTCLSRELLENEKNLYFPNPDEIESKMKLVHPQGSELLNILRTNFILMKCNIFYALSVNSWE